MRICVQLFEEAMALGLVAEVVGDLGAMLLSGEGVNVDAVRGFQVTGASVLTDAVTLILVVRIFFIILRLYLILYFS